MTRSFRHPPLVRIAVVTLALAGTGASCVEKLQPCVLPRNAPLPEVLHVVNRNARLVHSVFTDDVDITGSYQGQSFMLGARMAVEKPQRFRLVARALGSEQLDLGSNDRQFWYWIARAEPPALYYCNHDQRSAGALAFDPNWITEALGIGELDAAEVYEGPIPVGGGRLEIRSHWRSPQGEQITKLTSIDACHGWIVEQALVGSDGRVIAQAVLSQHQPDRASGAVIPQRVQLTWPDADLTLKLSLHDVRLNELPVGGGLWDRPAKPQEIDLCASGLTPLRASPPSRSSQPESRRSILPTGLFRLRGRERRY